MKAFDFSVRLKGLSPILFSRDTRLDDNPVPEISSKDKRNQELYVSHLLKYFRRKIHQDKDGFSFLPQECIRAALRDSQKMTAIPIKIGRVKDLRRVFISCVLFDQDSLYFLDNKDRKIHVDSWEPKKALLGERGQTNLAIRPVLSEWNLVITGTILDPLISSEILSDVFKWIGFYSGFGSYSVRSGGVYGRFEVIDVKVDNFI